MLDFKRPHRPLLWPDVVFDLADLLAGTPEPVYIVGGAVRDALLHRPLKDLDLAVRVNATQLARRIANSLNGDFFVLDAERDVGRAFVNTSQGRITIDVARFRGDDLYADLRDRDFTLNAMAVDLTGDLTLLIDPLDGEKDTQDKRIRRCAPGVIDHDPIRVLRAVRQSVQLGFRIEAETLREMRQGVPQLADISPERRRDEFMKLLALPRPAAALRVADAIGALVFVFPEVALLRDLKQEKITDSWVHTLQVVDILATLLTAISPARTDSTAATFGLGMLVMQLDRYRSKLLEHIEVEWPNERPQRALLMLAALLHDCGRDASDRAKTVTRLAEERATTLRLSNHERHRLVWMLRLAPTIVSDEALTPLMLHHFWSQAGEAGLDAVLLAVCDYLGEWGSAVHQDKWLALVERVRVLLEAYYDRYDELVEPPALLDGEALMTALELKPGPLIGKLLAHIREAQVTGEARTPEDALDIARAYLAKKRSTPR